MTATVDAGLRREYIQGHPFACFEPVPGVLCRRADGFWRLPGEGYPPTSSLRATKPPT